jgi:hypothetical protein
MKTTLSVRVLGLLAAGAGLTAPGFASPYATSATGVGTVLANTMSPDAVNAQPADPEWPAAKHTPTGSMFKLPFDVPKLADIAKTASGWEYSGQIEVGAIIGHDADERNSLYRMYQDVDEGAYLNNFNVQLKNPEGNFIDLTGGGAGRRDQYYGIQFGRANAWKVKLFFSEIPHVFTSTYKSLWNGVGTGNLTLLPGLTPGGTASTAADNAAVAATALSVTPMTLSLARKRGGVRLDVDLTATWKAYAGYSFEQRRGARPFGAVWGNSPGTAPIEIPEPIDYHTHDFMAGLQHVSTLNAFNLRLSASIFENKINTLLFQEPYRIAPPGGITTVPATGAYTQGQFDLTPSNQAYNARAEYTRSFPDFYKSALTAVVGAGTWRQNDKLLPYTTVPNLSIANVTLLPGGAWDTTGSLSRLTAKGDIETRLVDLTYAINPTDALNVKAKGRYYESANHSDPYYAVNPNAVYTDSDPVAPGNQTAGLTLNGLTGVWGRVINDGSGQSILMAQNANPAGNIEIRNHLYSSKQYRFGPTGDYQLTNSSNLTGTFEEEITERANRERKWTWEDRYKLGYVNRGLGDSTLRASYEFGHRRGSEYVTNYFQDTFSVALIPMPTTAGSNVTSWVVRNNNALRNLELSDRDQHIANVRFDTMIRSNVDAGFSLQHRESRYPDAAYGRGKDAQDSANLDLSYQPSPKQNIYGFYSYQQGRIRQATISQGNGNVVIGAVTALGTITPDNAAAIGEAPGGPIYPLLNAWSAKSTDRNHVFGLGVKEEIGKATLNVDYTYSLGRTRIAYAYTVGGAINAANAVFAGSRMPDLANDTSYLDASLRIPLTARFAVRLLYRNQWEAIRDWHYQNLANDPVVLGNNANAAPTAVILDGGPMDYRVNWFGVLLQIKL